MQCVILAGGLATRMRPVTEAVPKALIVIDKHPFIHYQLRWLSQNGVTDIILSIGYKGEMLRAFVGDGSKWGLNVRYVDEGVNLKGTGGALRLAFDDGVLEDAFLVIYGDSFLPINFNPVWEAFILSKYPALMTVFANENRFDKSNVWFENGKISLYDKLGKHPEAANHLKYIDYGLSAFRREVIKENIPKDEKFDLATLLYALCLEGRLFGYEVTTRFYETGSFTGLSDFAKYLKDSPF